MKSLVRASILISAASLALSQDNMASNKHITMAQARKIALSTAPGKIKSAELEKEKGKQIYSFDIRSKDGLHEVNVDAASGAVLENKIETPADEAKEKQADQAKSAASKKSTQ